VASCFPQTDLYQDSPIPFPLHPFVLISVSFFSFPSFTFYRPPLLIHMTFFYSMMNRNNSFLFPCFSYPFLPPFHSLSQTPSSFFPSFLIAFYVPYIPCSYVFVFLLSFCFLCFVPTFVGRAGTIYCFISKKYIV
jgi:hypothetical protein